MHTHPGEEIIYVLEGTLEYEIGGKAVRVRAGDVLFVPAGTPHSARNIGGANGAELATYVVEKASRSSHWSSDKQSLVIGTQAHLGLHGGAILKVQLSWQGTYC